MRNISNSEVIAWLSCRRMYKYAFLWNLAPKVTPQPLARGNLGHEYFQRYAELRIEGLSHEAAMSGASKIWMEAMKTIEMEVVMQTRMIVERYMAHNQGWPEWRLIDVEQRVDMPMTSTLVLPIRYDVKVEEIRSGKILMGDWKFTFDFWQPEIHELNPQMPKYIAVLQNNGHKIDGGFIEEIRTRNLGAAKASDPKQLWRRTFYYPSYGKKKETLRQHIGASLEIERFRNATPEDQEALAIPVLNKHGACKFCNFKDLCAMELDDNHDLKVAIETAYTDNTYGYNEQKERVSE